MHVAICFLLKPLHCTARVMLQSGYQGEVDVASEGCVLCFALCGRALTCFLILTTLCFIARARQAYIHMHSGCELTCGCICMVDWEVGLLSVSVFGLSVQTATWP